MTDKTPVLPAGTDSATPARRRFLGAAATGAAGAAAMAVPMIAVAQSPIVLKMQGAWGAKDIWNEMAEEYVTRVNEMSGGRLRIDFLVAGAVVKPFEVTDAVSKGVLDAGHSVAVYWYGKSKVASLFGSGPISGIDAAQTLAWIYKGGGLELYNETLKKLNLNIVGYFANPMPTQPLGWFKKEIKSAADMKGLKYRTVGLAADLCQEMGMKVTQLPGGEIVPAMDRGVIEAFEFNNPTSDRRFGAQDVAKWYMMGSYHQSMEFFEIVFNKKKHDSLPKDLQAILRYAAEASSTSNFNTAMDNYSRDLDELISKDKAQCAAHAQVHLRRPTQGLGRGGQEADCRGPLVHDGVRQPDGLGQAHWSLPLPEHGRLPTGLRARARQDPRPGLSRR
jgi:TRAP-type mannitol/chloroaromatic compound transport system substrate-binding protein